MHQPNRKNRREEIVFFDPQNPRAITNMVPDMLAKRIKELWQSDDAYLLGMTEQRLRGELVRRGKCPSATDSRIRLQFWLDYDRLQNEDDPTKKELNMAYVIGFAMAKEAFYIHYITDNCALAWILCPPNEYIQALEEVLRESMERVRESLSVDIHKNNGEANGRVLAYLLKTDQVLFQRWAALRKMAGVTLTEPGAEIPEETPEEVAQVSADKAEAEREARKQRLAQLTAQANKEPGT